MIKGRESFSRLNLFLVVMGILFFCASAYAETASTAVAAEKRQVRCTFNPVLVDPGPPLKPIKDFGPKIIIPPGGRTFSCDKEPPIECCLPMKRTADGLMCLLGLPNLRWRTIVETPMSSIKGLSAKSDGVNAETASNGFVAIDSAILMPECVAKN